MIYKYLLKVFLSILFLSKNEANSLKYMISNDSQQVRFDPRFLSWENSSEEFKNLMSAKIKHQNSIDDVENKDLDRIKLLSNILQDFQLSHYNWNSTPLTINLVVNYNFMHDGHTKRQMRKREHKLMERKRMKKKDSEMNKLFHNLSMPHSEKLGNIFQKMKLRMALKRNKRNTPSQNTYFSNHSIYGNYYKPDLLKNNLHTVAISNEREEINTSPWLKHWEDVLAMNPKLRIERPTKPDVEFIDEWKYSYRATIYKFRNYTKSNFICSGILVAPQWIVTSDFCYLDVDVAIVIGVHTLPTHLLEHNKYTIEEKIYSFNENLQLIKMNRPIQWKYTAPAIRALKKEEILFLLHNAKCSILSWIPVDLEKKIFEQREYPQLLSNIRVQQNSNKSFGVIPQQYYAICKKDIGSPVVCDGVLSGLILNVDEDCTSNMTMKLLCPVLEWITFFTKENSYYEATAMKIRKTNSYNMSNKLTLLLDLAVYIVILICIIY